MSSDRHKDALRTAARAKRAQLAAALPDFADRIARFADALPVAPMHAVASYWPLRNEADPRALADALERSGHSILLPCISGAELVFRRWRRGDPLHIGLRGAREPLATAPIATPDMLLIPLLAFDRDGFRLGLGGGYYDRMLAALRGRARVTVIGVAYGEQELDMLPRELHDQRLDLVVTEHGIRRFAVSPEIP